MARENGRFMKKKSSKTSKVQVKDLNPKKSDSVTGG
jgi:hypothetical protein